MADSASLPIGATSERKEFHSGTLKDASVAQQNQILGGRVLDLEHPPTRGYGMPLWIELGQVMLCRNCYFSAGGFMQRLAQLERSSMAILAGWSLGRSLFSASKHIDGVESSNGFRVTDDHHHRRA
jgi:hypothetical protein